MSGIGTERNVEESLKWLQEADKNGNIDATVFLGKYNLETGKISLAVSQMKKAAESGHSKAQFILSIMYKNGEGVEKNPELELYWCEQSANSGDSDAQYNLACLHLERGDDEIAVDLLLRSAQQGNKHAIDYINYINYINSL